MFDDVKGLGMGAGRWRDGADGVVEEILAGVGDAGFFGAGHGMTADEVAFGGGEDGFERIDDGDLDAADVGDDGAGLEMRGDVACEIGHLADGGAEDDEVGVGDAGGEVGGGAMDGAEGFGFEGGGFAAYEAGDLARQAPAREREAERATEQTESDEGNVAEVHGRIYGEGGGGRKSQVPNLATSIREEGDSWRLPTADGRRS